MRKLFLWVLLVMVLALPNALAQPYLEDHSQSGLQWAWELKGSPSALTAGSELVIVNDSGYDWTGLGYSLLSMPDGWIADLDLGKIRFHVGPGDVGSLGIFEVQATNFGLVGSSVVNDTGASTLVSSGPPAKTSADSPLNVPAISPSFASSGHLVYSSHNVLLRQGAWELVSSPTALTAGSEVVILNSSEQDWTGLGYSVLSMPAGWIADLDLGKIRFYVGSGDVGSLGIFQVQATKFGLEGV